MNAPSDYSIIISLDERDLVEQIKKELTYGWIPFGAPYLNRNGHVCQAVVKK